MRLSLPQKKQASTLNTLSTYNMTYQIISKWNDRAGRSYERIEPQDYWIDAVGDEECWDSNLTLEQAEAKLAEYNRNK